LSTAFDAPHDELDGPYWSGTRLALTVVVILIVAMWAWIYLFAPRSNPDRLADPDFADRAESICAPFHAEVLEIPPGNTATTPELRARQVETGTEITREMVAALQSAAASVVDPDDIRILDAWFEDWQAYLIDREAHAVKLDSAEPGTPSRDLAFTLTERASGGIYTRRIDGLANVNDMESCQVPRDV